MEGRSDYIEHIHIVKTGITELDVDCVVNAANEGLWKCCTKSSCRFP